MLRLRRRRRLLGGVYPIWTVIMGALISVRSDLNETVACTTVFHPHMATPEDEAAAKLQWHQRRLEGAKVWHMARSPSISQREWF